MANVNPLDSIFKSKSGYSYSLEDLKNCINHQGYLYDIKYTKENSTQPPMPFSAEEMNKLMSNEALASTFRDYVDLNLAKIIPKSLMLKGNTLTLMQNLLETLREGAKINGGLNWFLLDREQFNKVILLPLHNLYSHLKNYPDESNALDSISAELKSKNMMDFNLIFYLDDIVKGNCAASFPHDLSTILSVILSLDLFVFQEEKRNTEHNKEKVTATAFFDKKPMTNYQGIKVVGTLCNSKVEEMIKTFIDYLDQKKELNRFDIKSISVENDRLLIETKDDRAFKTKLRDEVVKKDLGVDVDNVDGYYKFYIRNMSQLQEKLATISVATQNESSIFNNIN